VTHTSKRSVLRRGRDHFSGWNIGYSPSNVSLGPRGSPNWHRITWVRQRDSSITRVGWVFRTLMQRDGSGQTWLPALLSLFPNLRAVNSAILLEPGELIACRFGNELTLPPPLQFLRWMVEHPAELRWPRYPIRDAFKRDMRQRLFQCGPYESDSQHREKTIDEARRAIIHLLEERARGVADDTWIKQWWVLEGRTHVDCFIETTRMRLYIEGKRTESLSRATSWYSKRNQLLRNLECASVHSGATPYLQVLITESTPLALAPKTIEDSLPHLSLDQRQELLKHYAGACTWTALCSAVGLELAGLPDTVDDVMRSLDV
jgi:hypothetical protein